MLTVPLLLPEIPSTRISPAIETVKKGIHINSVPGDALRNEDPAASTKMTSLTQLRDSETPGQAEHATSKAVGNISAPGQNTLETEAASRTVLGGLEDQVRDAHPTPDEAIRGMALQSNVNIAPTPPAISSVARQQGTTHLILRSEHSKSSGASPPRSPSLPLDSFQTVLDHGLLQLAIRKPLWTIEAFKTEVNRLTRTNYQGRRFVLIQQLQHWMRQTGTDKSRPDNSWLVLLLIDSYLYHGGIDKYPSLTRIRLDIGLSSNRPLFRIFCILLQIDAGYLIEPLSFFLSDNELPLDARELEAELRTREILPTSEDASNLAERFTSWQYFFCCRSLKKREVTKFGGREIVPITHLESLSDKGEIANVYRIEIPADYISAEIQELTGGSFLGSDDIPYFEFAVKSFSDPGDFHHELANFTLAQDIPFIVQCFSHYEIHAASPSLHDGVNCQYSLVLELGQFDLADLMQSTRSPVLFRDVFEVWNSLSSVVEAVQALHKRAALTETKNLTVQGWHADIKPDNILRMGNNWKLADLGFSKFKLNLGSTLSKVDFVGGTVTYGAPETFLRRSRKASITPSIDIWSLGAVLSTVATWIVLGTQGVAHFRRVRQTAIHYLITENPDSGLYTGDYFHNGSDVLPEVKAWHEFLRCSLRRSDFLTCKILDLVDQQMLHGDAKARGGAAGIKQAYSACLAEAQRNAKFEPQGTLWSQYRNTIFLAEQDASEDEDPRVQFTDALVRSRRQRGSRLPPGSPQQHVQSRTWPIAQAERQDLVTSVDKSSPSTDESPIQVPVPQSAPLIRPQSPTTGITLDPRYDMSWARKNLRLNEKRLRSPTRSLLISAAKRMGMKGKVTKRRDELLVQFYKDRYLVFLVDNSSSMRGHWSNATLLLETLVALTKGVDNIRGIDLRFTFQNVGISQERNVRQFLRAMELAQPKTEFQAGRSTGNKEKVQLAGELKTNMAMSLSELFAEYKDRMKKARGFTIIVLTDGLWARADQGEVREEISKFAAQYGLPLPRHRPFSIEFVRFGDSDGQVVKKLKELDESANRGIGDIVDTEIWTGSIYKMLLGSFVEAVDKDRREALRAPFPKEEEDFDPDSD